MTQKTTLVTQRAVCSQNWARHTLVNMPDYQVKAAASDGCFTIRYQFRPDSLDKHDSMRLEQDGSEYVVQTDKKSHIFRGSSTPAKDVECVLVWNAEAGCYELRQLQASLRVSASREEPRRHIPTLATPPVQSPNLAPSSAPSSRAGSEQPSPAATPQLSAGFKYQQHAPRNLVDIGNDSDNDDFGDLENELAGDLGDSLAGDGSGEDDELERALGRELAAPTRVLGTAGPSLEEDEDISEEE